MVAHGKWDHTPLKTTICRNGHDKDIVGRSENRTCKACRDFHRQEATWRNRGILNFDGSQFTMLDYDRAYQIQQGRCANKACNKHQSELTKRFHVDHNHETGIFRGLLCSNCNVGIGQFKDNKNLLLGAIEYLSKEK